MILERLFENLVLTVDPFATCRLADGWRLRLPCRDWVTFHYTLRGGGGLRLDTGETLPLDANVLAVMPPNTKHAIECGSEVEHETGVENQGAEGPLCDFTAGPRIFLSDSASASTRDLGVGVHQIVCTASDGGLDNNDLVTITVTNDAPIVTIVNPDPDGALTFFTGEAIAYVGSVFDADFNAELEDLQWDLLSTSGGPTLLTDEGQRGTIPAGTLEPGEYQLRAYVRDALREVGTTWITFEVLADPEDLPPSIVDGIVAATPIDSNDIPPVSYFVEQCLVDINADGYHDGHDLCQRLAFNAVVTDDHDAPEDLTYTWTVREDGVVVDTFTTPASVTQLDLEPGHYEVELVATDTVGNDSAPYAFPFIVETLI